MLEKPTLPDEILIDALRDAYGLPISQIAFLPVGADRYTAVYRVLTEDRAYFAKLRWGVFDETPMSLIKYLSDQGLNQVIAPLATKAGGLWTDRGAFKLILYPFIEGHDGYETRLSDRHWRALGEALRRVHTTNVSPALESCIQRETYSPRGRERVKALLVRRDNVLPGDPVAAEMAALLTARHDQIRDLVERAERLANDLQTNAREFVLCHSDVHAGNVLIASTGALYIVDWDNPIFAPKERDLMFAGGSQFGAWRTAQEEETLFYEGYGQTEIDPTALAYYRYERIVQDIAEFCEYILSPDAGREDREQSLRYLQSNFEPNNTIETAYQAERAYNITTNASANPPS